MKQTKKQMYVAVAALLFAAAFSMTGCGKTESASVLSEQQDAVTEENGPDSGQTEDDTSEEDAIQESGVGTGSIMRGYSDQEKERMEELQQSYQNETAKPEKEIQEVDSAEDVTEGTLCYIVSAGEYYLPDRELSDEELLEIIDCNFRIALNTNHTQEEWDEIALKERAELEAKVHAAGGISEEKAVEIAQKALETDLGEKAKELKLCINAAYGWSSDLCVADCSEIKEKDKGALAYCVGFNNADKVTEIDALLNYNCTVNAVDGSILEAYTMQGRDNIVYYEH